MKSGLGSSEFGAFRRDRRRPGCGVGEDGANDGVRDEQREVVDERGGEAPRAPRSALVWLNRIYNVDLSVYNSSALSQFTTDMPAVAKAVLDAFDAGSFCGASTCSTCNITTPGGFPPVIDPTGCPGDCHVRTLTTAFLEEICGM